MKRDSLKQFVSLRDALVAEKEAIEARLERINQALAAEPGPIEDGTPRAKRGRKPGGRRPRNELSLREAVIQVTKGKPMGKKDIFDAVTKLGYVFGGNNPMNSLNVVLYSKKQFKNDDGKFSPL